MADSGAERSNSDLLSYLKKIDDGICYMDKRLGALESFEKKDDNFDKELKKIWAAIADNNKKLD